jgi:hypothetical protein
MLLVLGVVLAATYLLLRRAPLPERVDVGPWARGGGRLIAGSGAAGLIVMTVAIAGTGDGGLLVFLLLTTFTLPPLAAATAGLRSGWRLARNIRSSRVPALMSGVSVTVCAGFWTWFWPNLDTGKSWLIHTEARQNVGAAVIALVGLSSAIGTLLVARRLPVPTPLPAQAPARTTVRRRRELAPALITTGLIVNLIVAFSSSTRAEFHVSAAEGGSGDGSCSALLDVVTQPLSSVEYGWPPPPILEGATVVGAGMVAPVHTGDRVGPGTFAPSWGDATPALLVLERTGIDHAGDLEDPARDAVTKAGFTPAARPNTMSVDDEPTWLSLPYEGQGVRGAVDFVECDDQGYALVSQEIRPDRLGVCTQDRFTAGCTEMFDGTREVLRLVTQARLRDGGQRSEPSIDHVGPELLLTASVDTDDPLLFLSGDVEGAMHGWQRVSVRCDGSRCWDRSLTSADRHAVGTYRRGAVTVVIDLQARRAVGATSIQISVHRPV